MFDTSMGKDHSFAGSLEYANEILKLKAQVKLLDTALDVAADLYENPYAGGCWKQEFIKAAEKYLRGEK